MKIVRGFLICLFVVFYFVFLYDFGKNNNLHSGIWAIVYLILGLELQRRKK